MLGTKYIARVKPLGILQSVQVLRPVSSIPSTIKPFSSRLRLFMSISMSPPTTIIAITAAQRLDSRGKPTVQVRITTSDGIFSALVPSGASKGDYEAIELRDGNKNVFNGNGVSKAVYNVEHVLGPAIIEKNFDVARELRAIDEFMVYLDGTDDKSKLGANAILGISMACARASAAANVRSDIKEGRPLIE